MDNITAGDMLSAFNAWDKMLNGDICHMQITSIILQEVMIMITS